MNKSRHTWMSHVIHVNESRHIWMSHVACEWVTPHMNESCHKWMSLVPCEWDTCHANKSRHVWMSHITNEWVTWRNSSYVWRDLFICVTWLIHTCDLSHVTCFQHTPTYSATHSKISQHTFITRWVTILICGLVVVSHICMSPFSVSMTNIYTHIYKHIYTHAYTCVCTRVHSLQLIFRLQMCAHMCVYTCTCGYMRVYMFVYMCVCTRIHTNIYTHIYAHVHDIPTYVHMYAVCMSCAHVCSLYVDCSEW